MIRPFRPGLVALATLVAVSSCHRDSEPEQEQAKAPPVIHDSLLENQLAGAPSQFLLANAGSAVRWQNWEPSVLARADEAQRLILALVGSSRYPGCAATLEAIEADSVIVQRLNDEFVPVLVDLDLCREASLVAAALSAERRMGVGFPFLLLLSPDGAPVSWEPLIYSSDRGIRDYFDNSVEVISKLWREGPDYVREDSARKLETRRKSLTERERGPELTEADELLELRRKAVQRITSFFDEDLGSFAHSGGLFPAGLLEILASTAHDPELPARLRQRSADSLDPFLEELLRSSSIDPLDHGIYPASRGGRPSFQRDASSQARAIRTLARVADLADNQRALDTAIAATHFAEEQFRMPDGLFALTTASEGAPTDEWLWTEEQMSEALDDEEMAVWKLRAGTRNVGNLDPSLQAFRYNALSAAVPVAGIASRLDLPEDRVRSLLDSGGEKLRAARAERYPESGPGTVPSLVSSLRMISAYAALFTASDDDSWRERALELGRSCRESFPADPFLSQAVDTPAEGVTDSRCFTYALAIQAGFDLGAITLDDAWNQWALGFLELVGEHFIDDNGTLREVRAASAVFGLAFEDRVMILDETTFGLIRLALSRADALGHPAPEAFEKLAQTLPDISRNPIVHTDMITTLAHQQQRRSIGVGPDAPEALREAVARLPLQRDERRRDAELGAKVRLTSADGQSTLVGKAEDLEEAARRNP